jgi:hypothetical protein
MPRTIKKSLRLDAEFTEDTVGFALESYLALLSFPRFRFTIEPFSRGKERWLGADARLNGRLNSFKPFYMQFKRPSAYPESSTSKIISERKSLDLSAAPRALFFGLRQKQETQRDYQHNVLYRLRNRLRARDIGDATYVCPLFLDRSAYRFHVHMSGLMRWVIPWRYSPWDSKDILINSSNGSMTFDAIPVLREHVSIPPHEKVTSADHSYSFNEQGSDLCFHSPLSLPQGSLSLTEFLKNLIGDPDGNDRFIPADESGKILHELFAEIEEGERDSLLPEEVLNIEDGFTAWLSWGSYLKAEFQIEQFALMRWEA